MYEGLDGVEWLVNNGLFYNELWVMSQKIMNSEKWDPKK